MSQPQKELEAENSSQKKQQVQKPGGKKKLCAFSYGEGRPGRVEEPTVCSGVGGKEEKAGRTHGA